MTAHMPCPAVLILLIVAAVSCVLPAVALLIMEGFYDKLHYLAPPAILGTAAVAAAILVQEGFNKSGLKSLLVLAVMVISNPVVTHAAARAEKVRYSRWKAAEEKKDQG